MTVFALNISRIVPLKTIILFLGITLSLAGHSAFGQTRVGDRKNIFYIVGNQASDSIIKYMNSYQKAKFFCVFTTHDYQKYSISIVNKNVITKNDSSILIQKELLRKTHRYLVLTNNVLLPLLFNEDFSFAAISARKTSTGSIIRKKNFFIVSHMLLTLINSGSF